MLKDGMEIRLERVRENAECLIFAGRGEDGYLGGASQQRPIRLRSWQTTRQGVGVSVGGVKGREGGRVAVLCHDACAPGESAKVQHWLHGFSRQCDAGLENWSRHPDSRFFFFFGAEEGGGGERGVCGCLLFHQRHWLTNPKKQQSVTAVLCIELHLPPE